MRSGQVIVNLVVVSLLPPCAVSELTLSEYNLCLTTEDKFTAFWECVGKDSSATMKQSIDEVSERFPSMSMYQITRLVCDASGDNGEPVLQEYLDALPDAVQEEAYILANQCIPLAMS